MAEVSLLDVRLETGRTHQIRVHLAAIDHPILGDRTYSSLDHRVKSPRVMLHARRWLRPPGQRERIWRSSAPLPEDMRTVLDGLRSGASRANDVRHLPFPP